MGRYWKPVFIVFWCATAIYLPVGVALGDFFNPNKGHLGLRYESQQATGRMLITEVAPGGPAERAGLRVGGRSAPTTE